MRRFCRPKNVFNAKGVITYWHVSWLEFVPLVLSCCHRRTTIQQSRGTVASRNHRGQLMPTLKSVYRYNNVV